MCYAISNRNKPKKIDTRFLPTLEFDSLYQNKVV